VTSIARERLRAHRLVGPPFASPIEAVRAFGAVQAQDFAAAAWAVGRRTRSATADSFGRLFDEGAILRTHILRPTWHFVLPEDLGWLVRLTGPRLGSRLAGRRRQLGIDGRTIERAEAAFASALRERGPLTRPELGDVLEAVGIDAAGQRLPHLLLAAEVDGVIVSGPRRGKAFTYASTELRLTERDPRDMHLDREAALGDLTRRYFAVHGPAQVADFVWWSGVTTADARAGIEAAGDALARRRIDGADYWSGASGRAGRASKADGPDSPVAHLLPNFDEFTVGYRDRSAVLDPRRAFDASMFSFGSVLSNVVLIDGVVRGSWRRIGVGKTHRIDLRLLGPLTNAESASVRREVDRYGRFLGAEIALAKEVRRAS
jgi:hypothetical protein